MSETSVQSEQKQSSPEETFKAQTLADYRLAVESREASLIGRREVLTGKAKFGIFQCGDPIARYVDDDIFAKKVF